MRMLYWPLRSPRRGSSALSGRAARSYRLVAASSSVEPVFGLGRAKPENSLTRSPLAKRPDEAWQIVCSLASRKCRRSATSIAPVVCSQCQFGYRNVRYRGIAKNGALGVLAVGASQALYLGPQGHLRPPDDTRPSSSDQRSDAIVCGLGECFSCQSRQPRRWERDARPQRTRRGSDRPNIQEWRWCVAHQEYEIGADIITTITVTITSAPPRDRGIVFSPANRVQLSAGEVRTNPSRYAHP